MGEAGAEAILPLQRGADGRLGVAASGGGGGQRRLQRYHAGRLFVPQVRGAGDRDAGKGGVEGGEDFSE